MDHVKRGGNGAGCRSCGSRTREMKGKIQVIAAQKKWWGEGYGTTAAVGQGYSGATLCPSSLRQKKITSDCQEAGRSLM